MSFSGMALADYHIHPDYSIDATGTIEEYCATALEKNLVEICFTTHYDSNPRGPEGERVMRVDGKSLPLSIETVQRYYDDVRAAQEKYFPLGLEVKCGIEVGYWEGCEEPIASLFRKFPFDYRLVAIHDIDDICVCCKSRYEACFSRFSVEEMADKYFALVKKAAKSALFDCLAHLDVYKKYGIGFYGNEVLAVHRGRVEPVLETMAEYNLGIEINTAALRRGHSEYYPSMEIVNLARQAGVRIAAIGSDAHKPEELAFDFEVAAGVAYELFPYCDE
ncbi:MAG: histidinol-phosphatase [Candidatus Zixiibacteriota bacterium]